MPDPRPTCWRCRKPASLCLCDHIPVVHNRTGIVVLQHRKERNHPAGTARFIRLGLRNQRQHVLLGQDGPSDEVALPAGAALLYTGDDAPDLQTLPPEARPSHLVLLDATWPLAHQLYRDNPWIQALPHVRLTPTEPSRYRIRREPRHECLSTLEAAVGALRILEPELQGLDGLLDAFEHLQDSQLRAEHREGRPRPTRVRHRPSRVVPAALDLADDDVVVAYIESGPRVGPTLPPLHWTAVRWRDGVEFESLSHIGAPLPESFVAGLGLDPAAPAAARPVSQVAADFADFCGPEARVLCWNRASQEHAAEAVGTDRTLRLKPVWTNLRRTRYVSHLDDIVAELGLLPTPLAAQGRAGRRLACTDAMARHIRGLRDPARA